MSNPAKRKGDRAELEAAEMLSALTSLPVRRKLGAGRADDVGDLDGIDGVVVQVANWTDVLAAYRVKPVDAVQQRSNAGADVGVALIRHRGGDWRVAMTVPEFVRLLQRGGWA